MKDFTGRVEHTEKQEWHFDMESSILRDEKESTKCWSVGKAFQA